MPENDLRVRAAASYTPVGYYCLVDMTYSVPGMSCAHCERAVTTELKSVAGVTDVRVDLATKVVTVDGEALDDSTLRAAIADAGYEAV